MPSHVTAPLYEGTPITFREFALRAIAVTGLGLVLDGAPLPERFEPEPYYAENVEKARAHLAAIETQTPTEAEAEMRKSLAESAEFWLGYRERCDQIRKRYDAMLARVMKWPAPQSCHEFKRTMFGLIEESVVYDCFYSTSASRELTLDEWRRDQLQTARDGLIRAEARLATHLAIVAQRNQFLADLRASLPAEGAADDQPIGGKL